MRRVTDGQERGPDRVPAELEHTVRLLPDGLEQAAGLFPAHSPDLVGRAAARGRHLRRVRRARLGSAVAVLAVGAGLLTARGTAGGGNGDGRSLPAPAASLTAAASTAPPSLPGRTYPPGFVPARDLLVALLPSRGTLSGIGGESGFTADHQLFPPPGPSTAWLRFTDTQGMAKVMLNVQDGPSLAALHACGRAPASACRTLADGTVVQSESDYSNGRGPDPAGTLRLDVAAYHPDGRDVLIVELVPDSSPEVPRIPLSSDELRTIVMSPTWNK